jgi:ribosome-associated protein
MGAIEDVPIGTDAITLGQLLKLAGIAGSGGEARHLLAAGGVLVDGEPEGRRGRKLRAGDVVAVGQRTLRVVPGPPVQ